VCRPAVQNLLVSRKIRNRMCRSGSRSAKVAPATTSVAPPTAAAGARAFARSQRTALLCICSICAERACNDTGDDKPSLHEWHTFRCFCRRLIGSCDCIYTANAPQ
jgi:hypothetical protein